MTLESQQDNNINNIQTEEENKEKRSLLPSGIQEELLKKIVAQLYIKPCKTIELAHHIKYGRDVTQRHLNFLLQNNQIEKIPLSHFYQLIKHKYEFDFENDPITRIPQIFFREIPIIKKWYQWSIGIPSKIENVNIFQNICYGEVCKTFKINPSKWQHPFTTEKFYIAYKTEYGKEYPEHIIKAVRAFLNVCLKVNLGKNNFEALYLGLAGRKEKSGKYRYLKFTKEDRQKAEQWLETKGVELAKESKMDEDRLLAHFAFAFEGFPRPSRIFTTEVSRIEKYPSSSDSGFEFRWMQLETKQDREYPKIMLDPKYVKWAEKWLEKRRYFRKKYLFVDDDEYQPKKYDSMALSDERKKLADIYKRMFSDIGKTDKIFQNDTLYALRHIGVQLWIERLGYSGLVVISQMGWEDMSTLLKYYAGIRPEDIVSFVHSALKTNNGS